MNTITKQWLQQKIAAMEAIRDDIPFGLGEDGTNTLAALRIALASLEAEPVDISDDMAYAFHHALSDSSLGADDVDEIKTGLRAVFANITAPPAPVSVPDAMEMDDDFDSAFEHGKAVGWNACRAAMLQGAEPVTTAYKLPVGWVAVPVEPTEDMIVNGFESEPDESFSDEKEWEAYDAMSGCQQAAHRAKLCWAAMIAAAPKLE
ncbi:hypothetical protein ACLE1M_003592 [Enterobacter hormaechei]|uniref:hypothetical protein n=1 Tax=Enterobacter cloacae complex TaxID=354276 RepID=UPI0020044F6D|nr:hypothetical protein [Enterobacter cloacae]